MVGFMAGGRRRLKIAMVSIVFAALAVPAVAPVQAEDTQGFRVQLVRVHTPTPEDKDRLAGLGLDLTEHAGPDFVKAVLHSPADARTLAEHGLAYTVRIPDLVRRSAENRRTDAAYAAVTVASPLPSGRDAYRHLADYERDLRDLAAANPGLVRLFTLPHKSLEGRDVLGVEISRDVAATDDGKPVFLMMGLHHAREWPSGEHAMEFAIDLVLNVADPRVSGLLDRARVLVVPVVNPDGFHQSRTWGDRVDLRQVDDELAAHGEDTGGLVGIFATPGNAYKRKNCRLVDGQPTPPVSCEAPSPGGLGTGVDLNRNYGGLWGGPGASSLPAGAPNRGGGPFSEPETQNVRELVSSRQVTMLITNHTFSNLILRPPGVRDHGETVDEAALKDLGARMAAQNGYRNIHGWQLYDTTGTTEDWSYNATGGFGYTFEIGPDEFHPPFAETVDQYLGAGFYAGKGNREAFLLALEAAADPAHHAVLSGRAPAGAVLRLHKEFQTKTSQENADGEPVTIPDRLESTLAVGDDGRYVWHVNPSTRPEVMEHRVRVLAGAPSREQVYKEAPVGWRPGEHRDLAFSLPETGVGALQVALDWPTPDDLDLYVYQVGPAGELIEVGSSGNFVAEKELALVDLPDPGQYVIRVVNYASVAQTFTVTAGVYDVAREDVFGGGVVEHWTLTCERPDGTVLQTVQVAVDRGEAEKVDLQECRRLFNRPAGAARTS